MPTADAEALRRSLHLSIDQSPYRYAPPHRHHPHYAPMTDYRRPPSPSSNRASLNAAPMPLQTAYEDEESNIGSNVSSVSDWRMFSVLCLYDFTSDDPDHLPFRKNELLDIVQTEDSGWWAALRRGTRRVGWVPAAFVQPLSEQMSDTLDTVHDELRAWRMTQPSNSRRASEDHDVLRRMTALSLASNGQASEWDSRLNDEDEPINSYVPQPRSLSHTRAVTDVAREYHRERPSMAHNGGTPTEPENRSSFGNTNPPSYQSSPPPPRTAPLYANVVNKPTPPTPPASASGSTPVIPERGRSEFASLSNGANTTGLSSARWPRPRGQDDVTAPVGHLSVSDEVVLPPRAPRPSKIQQITGEGEAEAFSNAQAAQRAWYLRPVYVEDEIRIDADGVVKAATLRALVERLTVDTLSMQQENALRHAFLSTFRTFATADEVFALLAGQYEMSPPERLSAEELEEWKEKKLRPTQKRVLTCMTIWLESDMLQEDPDIANRLQTFLSLIVSPPPLALAARQILQSLERLTFATPMSAAPIISPYRRKKSKIKELLKLDPLVVAQHLTLLESRLYVQVRQQQCLNWAKTQTGAGVATVSAFTATHEKLASWVKLSVLNNASVGKRAGTVDFWIKVAEKCRSLNNFSSTSAITAGLGSVVVSRLHLTWAHVSRVSHLDQLSKLFEPTANFKNYRAILASIDGPCVPFVGMYLSDLVHINDQYPDILTTDSGVNLIHFYKRERWAEAVYAILRSQKRPHTIPEDPTTMSFVEQQLNEADTNARDPNLLWGRSQELQQLELSRADIRKGLEAAGF